MGRWKARERRRWRRISAFVLLIAFLSVSATYVLGRFLLEAVNPLDVVETVGALRGNEYEDTSVLVFEGREEEANAALRGAGRDGGQVHSTPDAPGARAGRRASTDGDGASGDSARPTGDTVRVYFEPTPQLMNFLNTIDRLDRDGTLESIEKFLGENADIMEAEQIAVPVRYFYDLLAGGKSLPEAVIETMQTHGLAGKQAVERVVDLKRDEYEARLDKYLRLSVEHGVHKEHKIHRYNQKIDMVVRVRSELNKSFRIE